MRGAVVEHRSAIIGRSSIELHRFSLAFDAQVMSQDM